MDARRDVIQLTTHETRILQISLNRPEQLNALSHDLLVRLSNLFEEIKHDSTIKAVLLTGEGKGFCAGADIKQLAALNGSEGKAFAAFGQNVFNQLEQLGKPSLAAIHGFAFGGGCELAMAATLRMAANNAVFGQPEIKLGVIPGFGGTQRLARLIGKGRALEVCLTGRKVSTEEAYRIGLVNEVTTPENLFVRALSLLSELSKLSSIAMQSILTVIHDGYDIPLPQALELEAAQFGLCCTSADKREGVNAFLEKRTAVFKDK